MEACSKQFVKNKYGISIVKCCASCKHHDSKGEDKVRYCKKGYGKHYLDYYCGRDWEMNPSLNNAGSGGGKVKKPEYIRYITSNPNRTASDFERLYGSRYLTKR